MRYLLDTNIYFHTLHDPAYLARYRATLLRVTPQTFLSSVVRLELVQGARGDWMQAGVTQGRIWDDHPSSRTKAIQNDILIVCTARRIGAIVITENTADFDMIRPYVPHRALTMEEMARQLGG